MFYYVYVLQNKKGELYKGFSADLRNRVKEHNSGEIKSAQNGRPWKLVYYEAFLSKRVARVEELYLKSGKGRERVNICSKISW